MGLGEDGPRRRRGFPGMSGAEALRFSLELEKLREAFRNLQSDQEEPQAEMPPPTWVDPDQRFLRIFQRSRITPGEELFAAFQKVRKNIHRIFKGNVEGPAIVQPFNIDLPEETIIKGQALLMGRKNKQIILRALAVRYKLLETGPSSKSLNEDDLRIYLNLLWLLREADRGSDKSKQILEYLCGDNLQ